MSREIRIQKELHVPDFESIQSIEGVKQFLRQFTLELRQDHILIRSDLSRLISYETTTFGATDTTPDVYNSAIFITGGAVTITAFDRGQAGQIITIIAAHTVVITDGTNIFLSGSANWTMAVTDTLTLVCSSDGKWYEISRSDNT